MAAIAFTLLIFLFAAHESAAIVEVLTYQSPNTYTVHENKNGGDLIGGSSVAERCVRRFATLLEAEEACDADTECTNICKDNGQCGKKYELRKGTLGGTWNGYTAYVIDKKKTAPTQVSGADADPATPMTILGATCSYQCGMAVNTGESCPSMHLRNRKTGKCLTVKNNATTDGSPVEQQPCQLDVKGSADEWQLKADGFLYNVLSKKCARVGGVTDGLKGTILSCEYSKASTSDQTFSLTAEGHLKHKKSHKCLDFADASTNGLQAQITACAEGAAKHQVWEIVCS